MIVKLLQQKTAVKSINPKGFTPATADGLGKFGLSANGSVKSVGAPVIPVVMAEFSDRYFQDTTTIEKVTRFFNEEGYHDEAYSCGSVADFYKEMSISVTPAVLPKLPSIWNGACVSQRLSSVPFFSRLP